MKLVIVIVSNRDVEKLLNAIAINGYSVTNISTAGQFLVDGQTTLLIGCDNDKVEKLYDIIRKTVSKREIETTGVISTVSGSLLNQAVDVEKNGAVVFTIDVSDFRKL